MNREAELADALDGLVTIVERVGCGDWRDENGQRLKDTKQWVAAYLAATKKAQPAVPDDVAKDAARYRWMRADGPNTYMTLKETAHLIGDAYDAAIDAAILSATDSEVKK